MQEHCLLETAARSVCVHVLKMPCFFFILKKLSRKCLTKLLCAGASDIHNFITYYLVCLPRKSIFTVLQRGWWIFSSNLKLDLSNTLNSFLGTGGVYKTSLPHSSTVSRPLSPFSSCFSCFWGFLPCWAPRSSGASCPFASHKRITIRNCTRGRGAISTLFPQASSPFSRLESKTEKLQKRSFQRLLFIKYYSTVVSQILLQYKKTVLLQSTQKRPLNYCQLLSSSPALLYFIII